MSLPSMFSMLIQSLYNVVDSMFVARFDPTALAAVSLVFPIQMLIISVAVGTGIGVNSLVSRRLGEQRIDDASNAAQHGILLAFGSYIVMALLALFFSGPFYSLFAEKGSTLYTMACEYSNIVTLMSFGVFIHIAIEKTLQATGNMIHPMIFQIVGAVTNIILDPIMIFGLFGFPRLGIAGAAIATVIGQILAMCCALYVAFRKTHAVSITFRNFKFHARTVREIYAVGIPSIVMQSIGSVLVTFLNKILVGFSETAVSVLGVYYKLQSFVFMPVFGLTHGVMPIMGYSFGARYKKRLLSALKIGCVIAVCIMFAGTLLFLIFPKELLLMFNNDPKLIEIGVPALRIICTCFLSAGVCIMFSTLFQAIGRGQYSLIVSLLRQLICILPIAYFLSQFGLQYFWWAFPISECIALVVSIVLYVRLYRKTISTLS
ncbi:MAG: MATE family efflux transporter [Clostridia bacterium]